MRRDIAVSVCGIGLAIGLWIAADAIPLSALADAVGPDGLPKRLAVALAVVSLWIGGRAFAQPGVPSVAAPQFRLRAFGVPLIGAVTLGLLPWIGYPLALACLLAAAAAFYGARSRRNVPLFALAGAAALWLLFAHLLGHALPAGSF